MTSKTPSGQISASDLRSVFGATGSNGRVDLGNFRVTHNVDEMTNMPLDEGVPRSGQITFNDLRNKRLNIIVRYGSESRPKSGSIRYDGGGSDVVVLRPIGSSKSKPSSSQVKETNDIDVLLEPVLGGKLIHVWRLMLVEKVKS